MGRGHGRVDGVDLIVEDRAEFVTDQPTLERVAEAYRNKYGWPLEIRDGQAHAPFGAPTAGPPPSTAPTSSPRGGLRHGRHRRARRQVHQVRLLTDARPRIRRQALPPARYPGWGRDIPIQAFYARILC